MIKIEKPTRDDAVGIQDIFYKTWLSTYPNFNIGITIEDIEEKFKHRMSSEMINKRIQEIENISLDRIFIVAKEDNKIIGVCKLEINEHENRLMAIYVLPGYQGKGVGRMLWEEVIENLNNDNYIFVSVASYNVKAINFYKKLGFHETGRTFSDERFRMPISKVVIPEIELVYKFN